MGGAPSAGGGVDSRDHADQIEKVKADPGFPR